MSKARIASMAWLLLLASTLSAERLKTTDPSGAAPSWAASTRTLEQNAATVLGCPMAHCDRRMSDTVGLPPPALGATVIWRDLLEIAPGRFLGSGKGLGCASNGTVAACSFGEIPPDFPANPCASDVRDVIASYRYAGNNGLPERIWSSGTALNCTALASAPLVLANGAVIAADNQRLIRFSPTGAIVWETPTPGGLPTSPITAPSGLIILATNGGPISVFDPATGALLSSLDLTADGARFVTVNTPAARQSRVYVITHHRLNQARGRLYALELEESRQGGRPAATLSVAWFLEVGGPAGASPLLVGPDLIFADGDRLTPTADYGPHVLALRDRGTFGELIWVKDMPGEVEASYALDPRGGFWAFSIGYPPNNKMLSRFRLSDTNGDGVGEIVQQLDVDALVGEQGVHLPTSALSVLGTPFDPVLVFGATAFLTGGALMSTYVVALDLSTQTLRWKVQLSANTVAAGQFPVMIGPQGPRIIFTNKTEGTWVIGAP